MKGRRHLVLYAFVVLLGVASLHDVLRLGDALPWLQMHDFQDFYCAGEALDRHANPYNYEPLHSCEQRVNATWLFKQDPALVIPAPQPPYDFPPFMALAAFPFPAAKAVYGLAIVAMVALAAFALARTGIPLDVAAMALALPVGYLELDAGQVVPFAFLFLALAGAALAAGRDVLAGICAALVAAEPHFGLPVALGALLFVPRARLSVLVTAVALTCVAVATTGPAIAVSYVTRVLPAHALTEFAFPYQYSITYLAHQLGASDGRSQAVGIGAYVAFLAAGLYLAWPLARSLGRREMLVFLPAAAATMGAPFLHMDELCFAIPAALVLATSLTGVLRSVSAAALCALMVPWIVVWAVKKLFLASIFLCLVVLLRLGVATAATATTVAALAVAIYALEFRSPSIGVSSAGAGEHFAAWDLAQRSWRAFTARVQTTDPRWLLVKIPSWASLAAIFGVSVVAHGKSRDEVSS